MSAFEDKIDCRIIDPESSIVRGDPIMETSIIRLGFRLNFPKDVVSNWVRLRVRLFATGAPSSRNDLCIQSISPVRIAEELTLTGCVVVNDNGSIDRKRVDAHCAAPTDSSYTPYALAYILDGSQLIWDWFPVRGLALRGTDKLLVVVQSAAGAILRAESSIEMIVTHLSEGDVSLEYPVEIKTVTKVSN